MKRVSFATLCVICMLVSYSCIGGETRQTVSNIGTRDIVHAFEVKVPDGRTITCISWSSRIDSGGGVSCDWQNYRASVNTNPNEVPE